MRTVTSDLVVYKLCQSASNPCRPSPRILLKTWPPNSQMQEQYSEKQRTSPLRLQIIGNFFSSNKLSRMSLSDYLLILMDLLSGD